MATETTSDKIIDQMVEIARNMKTGNQVEGLWKCFNIMVSFIKGQANLIKAMDGKVKVLERDLNALRESVEYLRKTRPPVGPVN